MLITVTKDINVEELIKEWEEIFTRDGENDSRWEFDAHDWEVISNTLFVLEKYYKKYGDTLE